MKWLVVLAVMMGASVSVAEPLVLTLDDVVQRTLASSPQVLAVDEGANAARAESRGAFGGMLPNVTAGYDWSVRKANSTTSHPQGTDITLVQPITLGSEWGRWRAQAALAKASEAEARTSRQEVQVAAATAYADVLAGMEEISSSRALVAALADDVKASSLRLKVSEGTKTDVAQSEARLASAEAALAGAEGRRHAAWYRLEQLAGPLDASATLVWPVLAGDVSGSTVNPSVQAAEARLKAQQSASTAAWWEFLPEASLQASTSHNEAATFLGGSTVNAQTVAVNVNLPLFAGGQNVAHVQAERAKARKARYELEDIRRGWERALATARHDVDTATANLKAAEAEVAAQERAAAGVRRENQLGTRSQLDVLNAEQELAASRSRLSVARRNSVVATYNVWAAEGRLVGE